MAKAKWTKCESAGTMFIGGKFKQCWHIFKGEIHVAWDVHPDYVDIILAAVKKADSTPFSKPKAGE